MSYNPVPPISQRKHLQSSLLQLHDPPFETTSEEEVVYVQRRKPKPKKPKQRKPPRVVYVTDSDDEYETEPPLQQPVEWINFV